MTTPEPDRPASPSRHDHVTMTCPICHDPFIPTGRQIYCDDACRAAAYRRRRDTNRPAVTIPEPQPRGPITVYECDNCATRTVGQQRCDTCGLFMRKLDIGGHCPCCDEPITITELVGQEITTMT